ncbi:MAG: hypothetical protein EA381_16565 [Planctomycetaceae bacterium]|nr:MAG: hypothetical protein EA381_16565 [Planctomycetaceae bacterium]
MIRQWLGCCCCLFASVSLAGEQYAFLVAVREYDPAELTSLSYTERDVTELAKTLQGVGFKESNTVVLTQTLGATRTRYLPLRENILRELKLLCQELSEGDTLVLAFSGHGLQFEDSPEVYFCPSDSRVADRDTLLSLSKLYESLADKQFCAAETKLMLVDACRNDPLSAISKGKREIELAPAGRRTQPKPPGGLVAFYSCGAGEKSYELSTLGGGHSIFLHSVIEAFSGKADLDGDGELTLDELAQYSTKETQRRARIDLGRFQIPERVGSSRGVLTLARLRGKAEWGPRFASPTTGMTFARIEPGEFTMGNEESVEKLLEQYPGSEESWFADAPAHRVRLTKAYYLATHEVTRGDFRRFVDATGYQTEAERDGKGGRGYTEAGNFEQKPEYSWRNPGFEQTEEHPVVNVSWNDAIAYCAWLSEAEGQTYRLPTEAEWEYACRAGTRTQFHQGDDPEKLVTVANVADASAKKQFPNWRTVSADDGYVFKAPVGRYSANRFGLHDMHGNVWEWCQDWYGAYPSGSVTDPTGPATGSDRVYRGGSWGSSAGDVRSAYRGDISPSNRSNRLGFRVALSPFGG